VFQDLEPFWVGETETSTYPYRFRFEVVNRADDVEFNDAAFSAAVVDAVRRSASDHGSPKPASPALRPTPLRLEVETPARAAKVWIEKTIVRGREDRVSGEYALGNALWSQNRATNGADVYRFMRETRPGDVVLHLTDNEGFTGVSRVATPVEDFEGLVGTAWEGDCYLVRLEGFVKLDPPLPRDVFFGTPYRERLVGLIESGTKNLFYNREPSLNQGSYLTPAPAELLTVLTDAYRQIAGRNIFPTEWTVASDPASVEERREPEPPPLSGEELTSLEVWPDYSLADCARETGLPEALLARWVRAIRRKGQAILYGPPGTGKTFVAERLARHLLAGGMGVRDLVQFHPAYGYEDFVLGIRPVTDKSGALSYEPRAGRFVAFCDRARNREGTSVLVVDEINRANLSEVFGELMYLLEYRKSEVSLAEGRPFSVPDGVVLLGTMNTADRSIALMDYALRRRFAFLRLDPTYELLAAFHAARGFDATGLVQELRRVNETIGDANYHLGVSFFLLDGLAEHLEDVWRMEVEPYLEEYFFDQQERADEFSWDTVAGRLLP
jgi:MoxR-like ATPase